MGKHAALNNAHAQINAWAIYYSHNYPGDGEGHSSTTPLGQAINGAPGVQLCRYLTCQSREPNGWDKAIKPPQIRRMDRILGTVPDTMLEALAFKYFSPGFEGQKIRAYTMTTGNSARTFYNRYDQGLAWVASALEQEKHHVTCNDMMKHVMTK